MLVLVLNYIFNCFKVQLSFECGYFAVARFTRRSVISQYFLIGRKLISLLKNERKSGHYDFYHEIKIATKQIFVRINDILQILFRQTVIRTIFDRSDIILIVSIT
jgi:hypothetical protein